MNLRRFLLSIESHLFKKEGALFRRVIPASYYARIHRNVRSAFLRWDARKYQSWIRERVQKRKALYNGPMEPGLVSVVTAVWDGSPIHYLKLLSDSLEPQMQECAGEWVILDNGCSKPELRRFLAMLDEKHWIRVIRAEENLGIVRGLRYCLEQARHRYILAVDGDDWLYPDCIRVVQWHIQKNNYPALLYTDEDKVIEDRPVQPYLKPGWDPVLLLNSAYIAHLGVIDREKALSLGAYTDAGAEGSPDWDLFIRFLLAGHIAVHIPEVVYSWRMHPQSTAADRDAKSYIHSSQQAVLNRYLQAQRDAEKYSLTYNPLCGGSPDWWIRRRHENPRPLATIVLGNGTGNREATRLSSEADYPILKTVPVAMTSSPQSLLPLATELAKVDGLIHFLAEDVAIEDFDWAWDVITLSEFHPDAVVIGGRIQNKKGLITDAGRYLGFGGDCGCPDRGRPVYDPGYFTQMWKQRSVSAVPIQFSVIRASFLVDLLQNLHPAATLRYFGAWAGAYALRTGKRVIYSPFLSGVSDTDWESLVDPAEKKVFAEANSDIIPDRRFYSVHLSLDQHRPYQLAE